MRDLPYHAFAHNQTSLALSLTAQDLLTSTKLICLEDEPLSAEPNAFARAPHLVTKLVRHGRRTQLKLDRDWP